MTIDPPPRYKSERIPEDSGTGCLLQTGPGRVRSRAPGRSIPRAPQAERQPGCKRIPETEIITALAGNPNVARAAVPDSVPRPAKGPALSRALPPIVPESAVRGHSRTVPHRDNCLGFRWSV